MQVDPIKPRLKQPETKRLKLEYDGLLSKFGFKFNLRRYGEELLFLRTQVKSRGDTQRTEDLRLADLEKENNRLRAEYNLQSLKQDMLVHMWSMHMLDADQQEDT